MNTFWAGWKSGSPLPSSRLLPSSFERRLKVRQPYREKLDKAPAQILREPCCDLGLWCPCFYLLSCGSEHSAQAGWEGLWCARGAYRPTERWQHALGRTLKRSCLVSLSLEKWEGRKRGQVEAGTLCFSVWGDKTDLLYVKQPPTPGTHDEITININTPVLIFTIKWSSFKVTEHVPGTRPHA